MDESKELIKLINSLSPEDQQKLLNMFQPQQTAKKVKHRRKKNKVKQIDPPQESKQEIERPARRKRAQPKQIEQKGVEAQIVPFKKGARSNNRFENSDLFNAYQQDIEIDRKLHGKNEITERSRKEKMIQIDCVKCKKTYEVNERLVFRMPNGDYSFTCNKCIVRR